MKHRRFVGQFIVGAAFAVLASVTQADTLYVDDDAPSGGDGFGWTTAYRFLQDALAAAAGGGVTEIRVAQGTYTPDQDEAGSVTPGDREATFQLINGVALGGGYAGIGAPDPDARDIDAYGTELSGDLTGDDVPDLIAGLACFSGDGMSYETGCGGFDMDVDGDVDAVDLAIDENSYNVVTASATDTTAVLDGFTITAGNADGSDAGPLNWRRGAGAWNQSGSPTIQRCTFAGNLAEWQGGGMYNHTSSDPHIIDCKFIGNVASGSAGGGLRFFNSNGLVTGCDFIGNRAAAGGGMVVNVMSSPSISNSNFIDNLARLGSGGLGVSDDSHPTVLSCLFQGNTVDQTDVPSSGGGMAIRLGSNPDVTDCMFIENSAREGGGLLVEEASATIIGCTFKSNSAWFGGGIDNFSNGNSTLINCLFANNTAAVGSPGIGGFGGAMYSTLNSQPAMINCTVIANTAESAGGGVCTWGSAAATLSNCIVYGNSSQIVDGNGGTTAVEYSIVEGGWPGAGNIDADPLFVDPDNGNFRLSANSSCIDAGDNTAVPEGITTDLDGNPRFQNDLDTEDTGNGSCPIVDMGSYEFPATCPWDLDCNTAVGTSDLLALLAAWGTDPGGPPDFDGDGNVGTSDLLELLANWGPCP